MEKEKRAKKSAKRGHNEGSIYKRDDGLWVSVIDLGYEKGKRKRRYFYGKTRKEAGDKLATALRDHQLGLPVDAVKQTVGQFLDHWLETCIKKTVRPKTYRDYSGLVKLHINPHIGKIILQKLTAQRVQKFLNDLTEGGLGARRVIYARTVLRAALDRAVKWALIVRNVAALTDPPRYQPKEITPLDLDQVKIFLDSIVDHRLYAMYLIALSLGLRQGELLGLVWDNVDYQAKALKVRAALQRVNGKLILVEPKTERSKRTLPISDNLITALRAHRKRQLSEKMAAGERWQETGLIFTTPIGTPLEPTSLTHAFQDLLANVNIPKKRFHDLRHSCATFLLSQGVPARTVMELLGHSNISVTMNTYAHILPETLRGAADSISEMLTSKQKASTSKQKKLTSNK